MRVSLFLRLDNCVTPKQLDRTLRFGHSPGTVSSSKSLNVAKEQEWETVYISISGHLFKSKKLFSSTQSSFDRRGAEIVIGS